MEAFQHILSFVLGLGLLLFGMNLMGKSLEKVSGGKLESILEKMTSNRIMGVLMGIIVTIVINSSAATTVMAIGFVNSGIMTLSQTIGIIMGANIGTTLTAWILSLAGLNGDNIFIMMMQPKYFTPVCVLFGIILFMFVKREKTKNIGSIVLGFAILMHGMITMSEAVQPLQNSSVFSQIILQFSKNPILGILAGAALTAIMQSSTATIGILSALSATGAITFGAAFPIIMGQNIGTCVTALISSVGANKNAKRTALIHLLFNVIGTVVFSAAYYILLGTGVLDSLFRFDPDTVPFTQLTVAILHTGFNVGCTLMLLPFSRGLEWLACHIVRDGKNDLDLDAEMLDPRFLNQPAFALQQCMNATVTMADVAKDNLLTALALVKKYDAKGAASVDEKEELVDKYEDKLGTYIMKISDKDLTEAESKNVTRILHSIGDFERISDHAVNLKETAEEIFNKDIRFTPEAQNEIRVMSEAVTDILELTHKVFVDSDAELALNVEPLEEMIDYLREELRMNHIKRTKEGRCTIETGFVFSDFITNAERVADHCSNIALCVIELQGDSYNVHEEAKTLKESNPVEFVRRYEACKAKYDKMLEEGAAVAD